jgi:hypothetical protein
VFPGLLFRFWFLQHGVAGMPQRGFCSNARFRAITRLRLRRLTFRAAAAGIVLCTGAIGARAGDNDIMTRPNSIYDDMMQVIGLRDPGAGINYSERSPLVIPPTRNLPPPVADAPPNVAGWPEDPNGARAKAKNKQTWPIPDWAVTLGQPLPPNKLEVHGAPPPGNRGSSSTSAGLAGNGAPDKTSIFSLFSFNKSQYATFTGPPARHRLTDPPSSYLVPSPDQPYGIGQAQQHYKAPNLANRAVPVEAGGGEGH